MGEVTTAGGLTGAGSTGGAKVFIPSQAELDAGRPPDLAGFKALLGITQEELATHLGVSLSSCQKYLAGSVVPRKRVERALRRLALRTQTLLPLRWNEKDVDGISYGMLRREKDADGTSERIFLTPGEEYPAILQRERGAGRLTQLLADQIENDDPVATTYPQALAHLSTLIPLLPPESLTVVASRPGGGKTALALSLAWQLARAQPVDVVYCTDEPAEPLANRVLAAESRVATSRLRAAALSAEEFARVNAARKALEHCSITFLRDLPELHDDDSAFDWRRDSLPQHEEGLGLLVVDSLDGMGNQTADVEGLLAKLRGIGREHRVPVIVTLQLVGEPVTTAGEGGLAEPQGRGLNCDAVFLLTPVMSTNSGMNVKITVAKNRFGPCGTIEAALCPTSALFSGD